MPSCLVLLQYACAHAFQCPYANNADDAQITTKLVANQHRSNQILSIAIV
jgi:hypothetical protein